MIQGRLSRIALKLSCISLLLNNFLIFAVGPVSYSTIGDKLISSYGIINQDGRRSTPSVDSHGIPKLSAHDQRKLVFSLLASNDSGDDLDDDEDKELVYQAAHTLLDDLELFYVKGKSGRHDNHLFSKFNCTTTSFGEAYLAKMLVSPLDDIAALSKRQAFIKQIYHDEALFNELCDIVGRMKKAEPALLSLWSEDDPSTKGLIRSLYFSSPLTKQYNTDATMLGVRTGLNYVWMARGIYFEVLLTAFYLYMDGLQEQATRSKGKISGLDSLGMAAKTIFWPGQDIQHFKQIYPLDLNQAAGQDSLKKIMGEMDRYKDKSIGDLGPSNQAWILRLLAVGIVGKGLVLGLKVQSFKEIIESVKAVQATLRRLQVKVIGVAAYINGFKRLDAIFQRNDALRDGLFGYNSLHGLFDPEQPKSEKFKTALEQLVAEAFKGESAAIFQPGSILSSYGLVSDTKTELLGALEAFGELDACLSVVTLMKKFEHSPVGYSFVQFVGSDKPYMKLEDFWNPQIDPAVVVPNTLNLVVAMARGM